MEKFKDKKILILSNHHSYTYNFRKEIIKEMIDKGCKVYINLPHGEKVKQLQEMGCIFISSPLDRRGMNPVKDITLVNSYYKIVKKINPDLVLSYTIKPNIYGGLVCRALKVPFIPNVTGLGTAVGNDSFLQKVLVQLYKAAFNKAACVFFQNESNQKFFIDQGIKLNRYEIIPGSGINMTEFPYQEYPSDDTVKFLFVGRIMKDKGIEELIEAARELKDEYQNLQFDAVGFCEDEYINKVKLLQNEGIINFHGVKNNVNEYFANCNAIIHPSYHEGMSNVLIEAAASGRPVLASNIPGCQEIFDEGSSGFGFESKNSDSLVSAVKKFIELSFDEKKKMGLSGRKKVESQFNRKIVVDAYLKEIDKMLNNSEENDYELVQED